MGEFMNEIKIKIGKKIYNIKDGVKEILTEAYNKAYIKNPMENLDFYVNVSVEIDTEKKTIELFLWTSASRSEFLREYPKVFSVRSWDLCEVDGIDYDEEKGVFFDENGEIDEDYVKFEFVDGWANEHIEEVANEIMQIFHKKQRGA